ncbi:hypothetical protein [Pontibacter qinzhouensis]|uniref:hypothetical protein n=1 Tax=Pontibacter qinzhouensis TaxID=2603253 RepID=UPI0034E2EA36
MQAKTRVKICCISSTQEARVAIACGAAALGLVGEMPSGPGTIHDQLIQEITRTVPPPIATFLLTSRTDSAAIIAHHQLVQTNTIQLVDAIAAGAFAQIRAALPGVKLVQVVHVLDEHSVEEAQQAAEYADAILLD